MDSSQSLALISRISKKLDSDVISQCHFIVMTFQLLGDGGQRGHLVPETVNAHFTASHSLCHGHCWGLAHNFYTSKVWYICPGVLLHVAEEKFANHIDMVCHGILLPEMENQLYYLFSFSFCLLFHSPGKMWSFLPRCASSLSAACMPVFLQALCLH